MSTTVDPPIADPTPPGAKVGFEWSGFPWWFIGILAVIAFPIFKIFTDPTWNDAYSFIKDGITLTVLVTVFGFLLAMALGLIVALGRMSANVVARNGAIFYIELIRGIPVLVTIIFIGLVVWPWLMGAIGVSPRTWIASPAVKATVAVGLIYAAFI
ncbi:MAG: ABC transporter permease subunit, partial [Acidimicrobiia bacterium]|nr:ABC transporter permease subunit [Acidimicrobiia bacterium]